jgi:hypothetical protein
MRGFSGGGKPVFDGKLTSFCVELWLEKGEIDYGGILVD